MMYTSNRVRLKMPVEHDTYFIDYIYCDYVKLWS